ncbi:MAG: chorismate synthase [Hespellia sp.]|nr:chorismate synthase [Hespellia sp.]
MSGSTFGNLFSITTWGESHGAGVGVVIDGCPAGLALNEKAIQTYLNRRKPGQSKFTTSRKEADQVEILSGVFEGHTTGTPISLLVRNENQRSKDYSSIQNLYRPGHADYTFDKKYGIRDYRGGGRSSARETIGRVAAGAVASAILDSLGITLTTFTKAIGPVVIPEEQYHFHHITENALYMPNNTYATEASAYLEGLIKTLDSSGGMVECRVAHMPVGIGETVFDKLDASLAQAVMSIGAVKAVEIGDGTAVAQAIGSQNNDTFYMENDEVAKKTNHSGGILGGMSDGSELILRASFKPTPSIAQSQRTITDSGEETVINIHGRHDPIVVPRAVVVVESMVAITLVDLLFANMRCRMDKIKSFYMEEKDV